MQDEELLRAWAQGDRPAGKELFERYYAPISRFFRNKVPEPADLVQRTFMACLESAARFEGRSSFRSFLFGIAINVLRKHYRSVAAVRIVDAADEPSVEAMGQSPSQMVAVKQEQRLLLAALRSIPAQLQLLLELHYWEQMSVAELAQLLELPEGTIKSRMRRGRQLVEAALAELAASPAALQSTLDGFDRWAGELREALAARGGPARR